MQLPFVSVVIPVLNAERLLPACLGSLRAQDYPADRFEILLADGGSTDRSPAIIREYAGINIDARGLMAEPAKQLAFSRARGEYLALIDADNEVAQKNWMTLAIRALQNHPEALGFESYYLKHPADSRLNRYLTSLLQISDPCAKAMSGKLRLLGCDSQGVELFELPADGAYPTGANGFIFRKELLRRLPAQAAYHEAAFFPALMRAGIRKLVKTKGVGVYHHYVTGWRDFFNKRQRAMLIYMLRKEEVQNTWEGRRLGWRRMLGIAYTATVIGPALEGLLKAVRYRDADWLLHPAAAAVSTCGNLAGVWRYRRLGSAEKRKSMTMDLHRQINKPS